MNLHSLRKSGKIDQFRKSTTFATDQISNDSHHDYLNDDSDEFVPKSSTFIKRPANLQHERTHASVVKSIGEAQVVKFNEIVLMPKLFEGERDKALPSIEEYQAAASINSWSQATMVKYFPTYLSSQVRDWYCSICIPRLSLNTNWAEIRDLFLSYYIGPNLDRALREEFGKLNQGELSVSQFVPMAYRLVKKVYPNQPEESNLMDIKDKLRPSLRRYLIGNRHKTIEDFHDSCMEIEDAIIKLNINQQAKPSQPENRNKVDTQLASKPAFVQEICTRCERNHKTELCRARFKKDGTPLASC